MDRQSTSSSRRSILETLGMDLLSVISPVSICMLLVVLLISLLSSAPSPSSPAAITAATLVYQESPSDSASQKLSGALLNALVFVLLIAAVTFLLLLLYYYNCTGFLKNYTRFSAFFVLFSMGGSILLSLLRSLSIPLDSFTSLLLLLNFSLIGVVSVFSNSLPIFLKQAYMVALAIIVAAWFTKLPEWTTWILLLALSIYDLVAVLCPGGPLRLLVEMASSRDEDLPALVYEARPTAAAVGNHRSSALIAGVELQPVSIAEIHQNAQEVEEERSPLVGINSNSNFNQNSNFSPLVGTNLNSNSSQNSNFSPIATITRDEGLPALIYEAHPTSTMAPTPPAKAVTAGVELQTVNSTMSEHSISIEEIHQNDQEVEEEEERSLLVGTNSNSSLSATITRDDDSMDFEIETTRGIRLGLGDFVFYSVLVGRAAMYDLMTVYACYLVIISGLGCTLILLTVWRRALPALPISITLGVAFYFLTRLLMEPFVVGVSTSLVMF